MSDIVNLNRVRKKKAAEARARAAAENRVKFGRSKAQKTRDKADAEARERLVEGARLDRDQAPDRRPDSEARDEAADSDPT